MDAFAAIADPGRRTLLDLLLEGPCPAGDLVDALPHLTQSAVSRHLKVLTDAGLVDVTPDGKRRIYGLKREGLAELDRFLDRYRRFWSLQLDNLEAHLERTHTKGKTPWTTQRTKAPSSSKATSATSSSRAGSASRSKPSGKPSPTPRSAKSGSAKRRSTAKPAARSR